MGVVLSLSQHWSLDPDVVFLNHGSFGACPSAVLQRQQALRAELERQPVEFFVRGFEERFDAARASLAGFLGAEPAGLVAVSNATSGVNAVLRSLVFEKGDELLVTDHEYNACRNALEFVAERSGARVVVVSIPFPIEGPAEAVDRVLRAVTDRTRLALLDHVTSQTGMRLPIERLVAELGAAGVDTLVDGAHAPGMLDLDVSRVGAAYYTGNCHKWLCAPKGAAFLYVREDRRERVRPLTISHGANSPRPGRSRFHDEFDWTGTDDPTAFLCVPAAIERIGSLLPGGWPEVRARNRALALEGRRVVADALGAPLPCPDSMIGSLASLPLPDGSPEPPETPLYADPLQAVLLNEHAIEVPVIPWPAPPRRLVRLSAQLYNEPEHYRRLAEALVGSL
ncbi:MAG: aminotransferase class V-fold PLP-dependent enzyme [bacterium]|nr:aminotransferase class V-fold PLP-dependent enzyme [bacterium]